MQYIYTVYVCMYVCVYNVCMSYERLQLFSERFLIMSGRYHSISENAFKLFQTISHFVLVCFSEIVGMKV